MHNQRRWRMMSPLPTEMRMILIEPAVDARFRPEAGLTRCRGRIHRLAARHFSVGAGQPERGSASSRPSGRDRQRRAANNAALRGAPDGSLKSQARPIDTLPRPDSHLDWLSD